MISVNNLRWTPFRLHNDGLSYSKAKPLFKQDYYDDSWRHRHECLQWLTKVVETLKENYAFRNLISYSISFVSSVNPVIPPPLNSILCRCCDLCSRKNRKINNVSGKKQFWMVPGRSKIEFHVSTLWSHIVGLRLCQFLLVVEDKTNLLPFSWECCQRRKWKRATTYNLDSLVPSFSMN